MFDFDTGKLVVIGVVALVVIGPKELPRVLRQVGQTVGKVRRMAGEFQAQFMEAMREAEMADVKDEMSKIADAAKINVAFDPVRDIRNQISGAIEGETTPNATTVHTEVSDNSTSLAQLEGIPSPAVGAAPTEDGLLDAGIARGRSVATAGDEDTAIEEATAPVASDLVAAGVAPQPTPLPSAPSGQDEKAPHQAAHAAAHVA